MISNITNRTDPNSLKSRVFVGNLNTVQMTKTELESVFSNYGVITGISVHKGYAFVQYSNETSARAAVNNEDGKVYYNMNLDVTVASEPKNLKRGRSNLNTGSSINSQCAGLSDLSFQSALASGLSAANPLMTLQQLGLEGLMGQPNLAHFAAAANLLTGVGGGPSMQQSQQQQQQPFNRQKFTRLHQSVPPAPSSSMSTSSAAKRTRLDGISSAVGGGSSASTTATTSTQMNALPTGARGQNLVSLTSPVNNNNNSNKSPSTAPVAKRGGVNQPRSAPRGEPQRITTSAAASADRKPSSLQPSRPAPLTTVGLTKPISEPSQQQQQQHGRITQNNRDSGSAAATTSTSTAELSEDILICGLCRQLFDRVDELISHKMAGCSLGNATCKRCQCRTDEPSNLECLYCGAHFNSAWNLMHHCHKDHGLTIFAIPSPPNTSPRQPPHERSNSSSVSHSEGRVVVKPEVSQSPDSVDSGHDQQPLAKSSKRFDAGFSPTPPPEGNSPVQQQYSNNWERDDAYESPNQRTSRDAVSWDRSEKRIGECSPPMDSGDNVVVAVSGGHVTASPCHRRSRRGEYGRHEVDDEDADDDEDDDAYNDDGANDVGAKVARNR